MRCPAIGGPYATKIANRTYWSAAVGPLAAGSHSFTIRVTDSLGRATSFTNTFTVVAAADLKVAASARSTQPISALDSGELAPIVTEAENRLAAAYGGSVRNSLAGVSVRIGSLASGLLGETSGKSIAIDDDAAGYGWFVDPTPADDSEFAAAADELAGCRQGLHCLWPSRSPYDCHARDGARARLLGQRHSRGHFDECHAADGRSPHAGGGPGLAALNGEG